MLQDERVSQRIRSDKAERRGLMAALDASQALVWFDTEGRILDANDNALNLFGYPVDEFLALDFVAICGEKPSSRNSLGRQWLRILAGDTHNDERNFISRKGRQIWTSVSYASLKNEYGVARRVVAIFIDLSPWSWKKDDAARYF